MDSETVRQLILAGEGPQLEFKERFTPALDREIVALANRSGGTVLVGVADDSTVVSLAEPPRQIEERVMGLCRNNVRPTLTPGITTVAFDEGTILVITVPEGSQKPYTANDICYVRAGSTTRRARPEELRALSFETDYTRVERTVVAGVAFESLNLARFQDYVERRAPGSVRLNGLRLSDVAVSWGLAIRQDEQMRPTVAGVLLFGLHPQALHPHWGVGAVRLAGDSLTDPILDRTDLEGPADVLLDEAIAFARRNMRMAAVFAPGEVVRQDVPEYPLAAVREVLTNAIVHRDYGATGRVILRLFEDRLEVTNPGGLPGDLTLDEITTHGGASYPRNPIVARVMRDWGRMEEIGRGLLRIQREMAQLGSDPPVFESGRQQFRVVLPSRHKKLNSKLNPLRASP